jgi:dephospho-CoA kinase
MQPGEAVYDQIVEQFGPEVVRGDGSLDRRALAELAFSGGRIGELNRIVHPATIRAQEEWMPAIFAADPRAVGIVESALVFEASGELSKTAASRSARPDHSRHRAGRSQDSPIRRAIHLAFGG